MIGPSRSAALGVAVLLCLTGCTTLVDAHPNPEPTASTEVQPVPEAPKNTFTPLVPDPARSTRSTRSTDVALESPAGRFTKGAEPLDSIVPGTGSMVLEERFTGPVEFDLPRAPLPAGSTLMIAVSCFPEGSRFTAATRDDELNVYNASSGSCGKAITLGSGGENGKATSIRVVVDDDVEALLGVARGETADRE
ncbi:hypothetical protein [Paeniglutamicibacter cryotolerans]|uniref:Secreted protein n=1 Tax=Paeniglutamicibacter cryotolerans TaxID=670079 RepID=A0A839QE34_9MICC|nr:hypothetical protein [Paeniglutamicibacter cryotolerans]MBB2994170.1 hypothetical protein [Paeniglutamicibacter cryotolerans]